MRNGHKVSPIELDCTFLNYKITLSRFCSSWRCVLSLVLVTLAGLCWGWFLLIFGLLGNPTFSVSLCVFISVCDSSVCCFLVYFVTYCSLRLIFRLTSPFPLIISMTSAVFSPGFYLLTVSFIALCCIIPCVCVFPCSMFLWRFLIFGSFVLAQLFYVIVFLEEFSIKAAFWSLLSPAFGSKSCLSHIWTLTDNIYTTVAFQ